MNYVEELLPELQLAAPGAPPNLLERYLRLGVSRFFRDHELWQVEVGPIYTFEGLHEYVIRIPENGRIGRLLWVRVDGKDIPPLEPEDMIGQDVVGFRVTNDSPHNLILGEKTKRGEVYLGCTAFPSASGSELPDALVDDFREEIKLAGLAALYSTPGSPEYDIELAALYAQQAAQSAFRVKRLVNNRRMGKRRTVKYGGI